jgi:hypothetical protein
MSSNEAIKKIPAAVGGLVQKLEEAVNVGVAKIEEQGAKTLAKVDQAVYAITEPLRDADNMLDELIGGHNGAPVEDAPGATFLGGAGEARSGAATAAKSQPSAIGTATGGITASDVAKK